jgi:outer membrane receptor protein involved in Fe transport
VSRSTTVSIALVIFRIDYRAASPFGNDTPYSPVPGIEPFALDTRFNAYQSGGYAQFTKRLTSRLDATAGVRIDDFRYVDQTRVGPRLGVAYRLTDAWTWSGSIGRYYQLPPFLFLSAYPQNRAVVPWRADHVVTGLGWSPSPELRATAEVYHTRYGDYPIAAELPTVSLANLGDTFDIRESLFPLTSAGAGESSGVELFVWRSGSRRRSTGRPIWPSRGRVMPASTASAARVPSTIRTFST